MSASAPAGWFDLAPCGLIAMTYDGLVAEVNDTLLTWTGYPRDAVVGAPFVTLLDPGSRLFHETRHLQIAHLEGRAEEVALTMRTSDGKALPLLVNSVVDSHAQLIRTAAFNASERLRYETELLNARRSAEAAAERVRVLQEISTRFSASASDEDVARSFADIAGNAFAARETAVMLFDGSGALQLVGGANPLEGWVMPVVSLRTTSRVTVVETDAAAIEYPELSRAMRDARLASLSVTPLIAEGERLGILVCFFARRTQFDDGFFELQKALGRQASQTLVRVRLQRTLEHLALHDQLTGVANRQLLQHSLDEALDAADASGHSLSVLFLDIDGFKAINDRFGHAAGDQVLVELAARLQHGVRSGDVVGRIGGDEFVAICLDADVGAATSIAQRLLDLTRTPIAVEGGLISASVSVGVAVYQPDLDERPSGEQLLVRADGAMYTSKDAGRNRFTLEGVLRATE